MLMCTILGRSKFYWVLFPIEDLGATVDTAKRMLTKEKIDKQLAGQSSSTTFMSMRVSQGKREFHLMHRMI